MVSMNLYDQKNMKEITAKAVFDLFCERFASIHDEIKLFPTSLTIEFLNGSGIIFYPETSEWNKMSGSALEEYYTDNTNYQYAFEQNAIVVKHAYDHDALNFDALRNQFNQIQRYTGFSYVHSFGVGTESNRHYITLTHFEQLTLETPEDYENLLFKHTLNAIQNSYIQYQKPVFSGFDVNKQIHTFVLRWWESNIGYSMYYGSEPAIKMNFSNVLYTENDVQIMLKKTQGDQEAFFAIWLLLYRVCVKLKEALRDHPMFVKEITWYPTFFDHFQHNETYSLFAQKNKELETDTYIDLLLKELEKPPYF